MKKTRLSNWTNYPEKEVEITEPTFQSDLREIVQEKDTMIARGNGRCYGDSSLSENVISTLNLKNIIRFNQKSGVIKVESGILLSDLLEFIVPKGWFLPVTPGTKFITIGGAIASNVHGKNHHKHGAFSKHVLSFELINETGKTLDVNPTTHKELFDITLGGMGLTGVVTTATIQLYKIDSTLIETRNIKAKNLKEIFNLFEKNESTTYSVAWIDCYQKKSNLGRSILMLGEHVDSNNILEDKNENLLLPSPKSRFKIPFNFPTWVLNGLTVRAFNFLFYHKQFKKEVRKLIHFESFFYPLDSILSWNRLYGKKGFVQYQFVLPLDNSYEGLMVILEKIRCSGFGSFLAVLKLFGAEDNSISFPMKGYTLALDFPIRNGLFSFLEELDKDVIKYGGRIYLSKDARMSKATYYETYKSAKSINKAFLKFNTNSKFSSFLSKRLGIGSKL